MKVIGISGKRYRYSFGSIGDLEVAINSWIEENQDKTIIDIKVIPHEGNYDALISYNKICTKDEYLNKEKYMVESCECVCGNEEWIIFPAFIKCSKCRKEYNFPDIATNSVRFDVFKFNQNNKEK